MELADTTLQARQVQRAALAAKTPTERVSMAIEMSEAIREVTRSGIRHRHPHWTEDQVRWELLRRLHGDDLVRRVRRSIADA